MELMLSRPVLVFWISLAVAWGATGGMRFLAILDHPKDRSSHLHPTPTSGGVGIIAGFLAFLLGIHLLIYPLIDPRLYWIISGALGVGTIGFIDELIEISFLKRLIIQLLIGAIVLLEIIPGLTILSLKFWILLILLGGFTNAYNFFDSMSCV